MNQQNVQILQSTKVRLLELETLLNEAREAQILPGIERSSLIYIGKLCDAGCEDNFNQHTMAVTKDNKIIFQGTRDILTGLCRVPLQIFDRT